MFKSIYLFSLSFLVVEIRILIICSSSGSILSNLFFDTILDSIIISIQYLHSCASFSAIEYFDKKSALDWANLASAQLAPIEVPLLKNCFDSNLAASSTRAFP